MEMSEFLGNRTTENDIIRKRLKKCKGYTDKKRFLRCDEFIAFRYGFKNKKTISKSMCTQCDLHGRQSINGFHKDAKNQVGDNGKERYCLAKSWKRSCFTKKIVRFLIGEERLIGHTNSLSQESL